MNHQGNYPSYRLSDKKEQVKTVAVPIYLTPPGVKGCVPVSQKQRRNGYFFLDMAILLPVRSRERTK